MERGDGGGGRCEPGHLVGEGPIEANVLCSLPFGGGIFQYAQCQLRLARPRGADDAQPEGLELQAPRPGREATRQAGNPLARLAYQGARIEGQLELIQQKCVDCSGGDARRRWLRQHCLNHDRCERFTPPGVDDPFRGNASRRGTQYAVVRAVQQIVEREVLIGVPLLEAGLQRVDRALHLPRNVLRLGLVSLDEAFRRLLQRSAPLLDQHHLSLRTGDDEIDLAENGVAVLEPRPMDAVKDTVVVGELCREPAQGRDLERGNASRFEHFPTVRESSGHLQGRGRLCVLPEGYETLAGNGERF